MTTSWKIFTRDLKRLARVPKVWVIIIGVMITPALYSWFNISAFWDPYENTGNIPIGVVNQDQGSASSLTGPINVGKELVDELKQNDELGWQFLDADEAHEALMKGDIYSTIEVPRDFSEDFLSMFDGTFTQPTLTYRPNEKLSAISPKITDQGATTIDAQITATFKEKVAEAATKELRKAGGKLTRELDGAQDKAAGVFAETASSLADGKDRISGLQAKIDDGRPAIGATQDALRAADKTLGSAQDTLNEVAATMDEVQQTIAAFSGTATSAFVDGSGALAESVASANAAASTITEELDRADQRLDAATRNTKNLLSGGDAAIASLKKILGNAAVSPAIADQINSAIDDLQERNDSNKTILGELDSLRGNAAKTAKSIGATTDALTEATADTHEAAKGLQSTMGESIPALTSSIGKLGTSAGSVASTLGSQQSLLRESIGVLDGVDTQLGATVDVLDNFKSDLASMENGVDTLRTDVLALTAASNSEPLKTVTGLDTDSVSTFMATPAQVDTRTVFPVNSYGSGMASLFTNLSLWIGAFMLVVIFRIEVDTKKVRRVTVSQAYRARFWLLACVVVAQALVVSIGDIVLGVQTANMAAFIITCILIGLAYMAVIYGLVAALGHIGRGIAVVLAFVQIPGASGLYPIEMTPDFFRWIYPLLPFTYGIDAMRETIGGFYGAHYWKYMAILGVMAVVAFMAGKIARRLLSNFNLVFNKELASTNLLASESVQVVGSGYRLPDIIAAMQNNEEFKQRMDNRQTMVEDKLPRYMRTVVIVGAIGVVVLAVMSRVMPDEKAFVFGIASAWALLGLGAMVTLEYVRQSYARSLELTGLGQTELQEAAQQSSRRRTYTLQSPQDDFGGSPSSKTDTTTDTQILDTDMKEEGQ